MVDRRLRKTNTALKNSLDSLLMKQNFSEITVQDIVDRADIGRATFYRHYTDKYDLLRKLVNHELGVYQDAIHQYNSDSDGDVAAVFDKLTLFLSNISIYRKIKDKYIDIDQVIKGKLADIYIREFSQNGIVVKKEIAQVVAATILEMMDIFVEEDIKVSEHVIKANAREVIKLLSLTIK